MSQRYHSRILPMIQSSTNVPSTISHPYLTDAWLTDMTDRNIIPEQMCRVVVHLKNILNFSQNPTFATSTKLQMFSG